MVRPDLCPVQDGSAKVPTTEVRDREREGPARTAVGLLGPFGAAAPGVAHRVD
jgi:hypothetical protein